MGCKSINHAEDFLTEACKKEESIQRLTSPKMVLKWLKTVELEPMNVNAWRKVRVGASAKKTSLG